MFRSKIFDRKKRQPDGSIPQTPTLDTTSNFIIEKRPTDKRELTIGAERRYSSSDRSGDRSGRTSAADKRVKSISKSPVIAEEGDIGNDLEWEETDKIEIRNWRYHLTSNHF